MPHVVVKMVAGNSEEQKQELTRRIVKDVMEVLDHGADAVSVAIEEVAPEAWMDEVYKPEIAAKWTTLYKEPGYRPE